MEHLLRIKQHPAQKNYIYIQPEYIVAILPPEGAKKSLGILLEGNRQIDTIDPDSIVLVIAYSNYMSSSLSVAKENDENSI